MKQINNIVKLPKNAHIEGGDVVLDKNHIYRLLWTKRL